MKLNIPQFKDKKELYKYLVANKDKIIALKQANAVKWADAVSMEQDREVSKALKSTHLPADRPDEGVIYRTVIANTYNWLDSHDDVHVKGIFTKTLQENKSKIRHTYDHVQSVVADVANVMDIYEKEVSWKDLDVNKSGNTICLMSDSEILASENKKVYNKYLNGKINQHSVEMIYGKMQLAINDPEEKAEYKAWSNVFPLLGNPEKALEQGFFFVQSESKLKAFSCVVEGSNSLTGVVHNEIQEPLKNTLLDNEGNASEPSKDTPKPIIKTDYSKIKFI